VRFFEGNAKKFDVQFCKRWPFEFSALAAGDSAKLRGQILCIQRFLYLQHQLTKSLSVILSAHNIDIKFNIMAGDIFSFIEVFLKNLQH
jgi:hypothetical protein